VRQTSALSVEPARKQSGRGLPHSRTRSRAGSRHAGSWPLGVLLLLVWLLLTALAGCAPSPPRADLVIINGAEPETLDPALALSIEDLRVTMPLFEGLTRTDPVTARPIPGLAERWDISADRRRYTFHLRTNAVWSTGDPITAADVAWSWRRALEPATGAGYVSQFFFIANAEAYSSGRLKDPEQVGFRAVGPHTFEVRLNQPRRSSSISARSRPWPWCHDRSFERYGEQWLRARPLPVSGPYQLEYWRLNDRVRLRRNPRYWDAANTGLEVVDLLSLASPNTALNLYETGQADVIWDRNLVPAELLDVLRPRPDCRPLISWPCTSSAPTRPGRP